MIFKCPNCGVALKYDPSTDKMICDYCISYFEPSQVSADVEMEPVEEESAAALAMEVDEKDEYMECNIYTCTSCGGELMVNGLESSTFCAYCGQPTIVFSRVSKELKPKYIVPFAVTKDQAIDAIRDKLSQGLFVPREIKEFDIERIRGIYIPYWLCDVDYEDEQSLKGTVGSGKNSRTRYFYRKAKCSFTNMTLDASLRLSDESSQRLEPFNTRELEEFNEGYLSGYYADRYDVKSKEVEGLAISRAKLLFDEEICKTISARDIQILKNRPRSNIVDMKYVLLPAWFLTFQYQGEAYTFLVNGQTKKVVGGVPFEKRYVAPLVGVLSIVLSIVAALIIYACMKSEDEDSLKIIFVIVATGIGAIFTGLDNFAKVKTSVELTKSKVMMRFVKDRQKEG